MFSRCTHAVGVASLRAQVHAPAALLSAVDHVRPAALSCRCCALFADTAVWISSIHHTTIITSVQLAARRLPRRPRLSAARLHAEDTLLVWCDVLCRLPRPADALNFGFARRVLRHLRQPLPLAPSLLLLHGDSQDLLHDRGLGRVQDVQVYDARWHVNLRSLARAVPFNSALALCLRSRN